MRTIKDLPATLKRPRRVTVELQPGEKLMAVHDDSFYRLGYPLEDVMAGRIVSEARRVVWCSIEQRWVE